MGYLSLATAPDACHDCGRPGGLPVWWYDPDGNPERRYFCRRCSEARTNSPSREGEDTREKEARQW